jgi:prophage maintenance system killer protein
MEDLSVEGIIMTHERIMADNGGDCRILSEANLLQLVFRANLIPELAPRAAFIFYSLCAFPAFREGNTGTALVVTEQVLASGGYQIAGEKSRIMALAEGILAFTIEPEDIEQWLSNNLQKTVTGLSAGHPDDNQKKC